MGDLDRGQPALRVERGTATEEELAALTVVLLALRARPAPGRIPGSHGRRLALVAARAGPPRGAQLAVRPPAELGTRRLAGLFEGGACGRKPGPLPPLRPRPRGPVPVRGQARGCANGRRSQDEVPRERPSSGTAAPLLDGWSKTGRPVSY
ncbi:acyl-CoA carboxylase subunit epsilon [Streptomyces sp. LN245]|uniref:acyl-CoA carboxylase subunit epsilon n=1 Tax=Streptomyces sp. LN245 TaxID=3112975 RepID=UPI00371D8E36